MHKKHHCTGHPESELSIFCNHYKYVQGRTVYDILYNSQTIMEKKEDNTRVNPHVSLGATFNVRWFLASQFIECWSAAMRRSFDVNFGQFSCWRVVTPHMSNVSLAQSLPESEGAVTVGWVAPSITSRAEIPWLSRSLAHLQPSVFSWSFSTSLVASQSMAFNIRVGGHFP